MSVSAAKLAFVSAFGGAVSVGLGVSRRGGWAGLFEGGAGDAEGVRFAGVEVAGDGAVDQSSSFSSRPKESLPRAMAVCFFFFFLGGPEAESVRGVAALYFDN